MFKKKKYVGKHELKKQRKSTVLIFMTFPTLVVLGVTASYGVASNALLPFTENITAGSVVSASPSTQSLPSSATDNTDSLSDTIVNRPTLTTQEVFRTIIVEEYDGEIPKVSEKDIADHGYDVVAAITLAYSEVGTSRTTGWGNPGECIMSVKRWLVTGGGLTTWGSEESGTPVKNYTNATEVNIEDVEAGDVIQYVSKTTPEEWVDGVHTVLITGVNDDGTFSIVESNNPAGSGTVVAQHNWTPNPPDGLETKVYRF